MSRPIRILFPGAFYHVMSRGNEKQDIFRSYRDHEKFLDYLESATKNFGAVIHCYCLMKNHYHLLIETPEANLPQIMHHVNGAYTIYFNTKWNRVGHLFQGRYKSILVDVDEYLLELSRYIHLNPVRAGLEMQPEHFRWSSYASYVDQGQVDSWLKRDLILSMFDLSPGQAQVKYKEFVEEKIGAEYENPLNRAVAGTVLGSSRFVKEVSRKYLGEIEAENELQFSGELKRRYKVDEIVSVVQKRDVFSAKEVKQVTLYFCHKYGNASLNQIGEYFGIGKAAVSVANKRFSEKLRVNHQLRVAVEEVQKELIL